MKHLVAVIGPSYGGFQAFQWAVDFPDFMDGVAPIVTAPHPPVDNSSLEGLSLPSPVTRRGMAAISTASRAAWSAP